MNTIILIGRFSSEIELRQTKDGKSVTSFSLAVKRPYTNDTTDFFTVVAWEKKAEFMSRNFKKGDPVAIRGYLTTRTWTDDRGLKRYATEIMMDEVSFMQSTSKDDRPEFFTPGVAAPMPSATQQQMPMAYGGAQYEDIPNDGSLPF